MAAAPSGVMEQPSPMFFSDLSDFIREEAHKVFTAKI